MRWARAGAFCAWKTVSGCPSMAAATTACARCASPAAGRCTRWATGGRFCGEGRVRVGAPAVEQRSALKCERWEVVVPPIVYARVRAASVEIPTPHLQPGQQGGKIRQPPGNDVADALRCFEVAIDAQQL